MSGDSGDAIKIRSYIFGERSTPEPPPKLLMEASVPDVDNPHEIPLQSPSAIRAALKTSNKRAELLDPLYDAALVGTARRVQEDAPVAVYMKEFARSLMAVRGDREGLRRLSEGTRPYHLRTCDDILFLE